MDKLISTIKRVVSEKQELPFSVYTSIKEQSLLNVPIVKPILIVILDGIKRLGNKSELTCHSGDFIFLSDRPAINMRNIPKGKEYFALLMEFEAHDFEGLNIGAANKCDYCIGKTTPMLEQCLQQFVESSLWAPEGLWPLRRREIIELLCHMGHNEIAHMAGSSKVGQRLHDLFTHQSFDKVTIESICGQLAMSESTLRRKLKLEGTSIQEVKDQARLGLGLHLLQTTLDSIGVIAERCGYQSQSRFTDRFKGRFGLTPSELRRTKMAD